MEGGRERKKKQRGFSAWRNSRSFSPQKRYGKTCFSFSWTSRFSRAVRMMGWGVKVSRKCGFREGRGKWVSDIFVASDGPVQFIYEQRSHFGEWFQIYSST